MQGAQWREVNACAILLVEKSMFERMKKRKGKKMPATQDPKAPEQEPEHDVSTADAVVEGPEHEWKKKVEDALRRWI